MSDLQFLCYAKPRDAEQESVCKKLVEYTLEPPGAREVALPAGKGRREDLDRFLPHRPVIAVASAV